MTLRELAQVTEKSEKELKDILYDEFSIIVLAPDIPLQPEVTAKLVTRFKPDAKVKPVVRKKKKFPQPDGKNAAAPNVSWDYTKKLLQYCIDKKYLIFIDTCSLLKQPEFFQFYECLKSFPHVVLYVPYVVTEELKNMLEPDREADVRRRAEKVLKFICKEEAQGEIIFIGNEHDKRNKANGDKGVHADRIFIEKLNYYRNNSRSCLFITQDHDVTVDVLKLNEWCSLHSSASIVVKKIGKGGILENNSPEIKNPKLPID